MLNYRHRVGGETYYDMLRVSVGSSCLVPPSGEEVLCDCPADLRAAVLPPLATPSRAGAHPSGSRGARHRRSDPRLPPLQFSTKTAEADTSSELAKKSKETFRKEVSQTFCRQCRQSPDVSGFPTAARLQLHQNETLCRVFIIFSKGF